MTQDCKRLWRIFNKVIFEVCGCSFCNVNINIPSLWYIHYTDSAHLRSCTRKWSCLQALIIRSVQHYKLSFIFDVAQCCTHQAEALMPTNNWITSLIITAHWSGFVAFCFICLLPCLVTRAEDSLYTRGLWVSQSGNIYKILAKTYHKVGLLCLCSVTAHFEKIKSNSKFKCSYKTSYGP